jgi:hypothetical protein
MKNFRNNIQVRIIDKKVLDMKEKTEEIPVTNKSNTSYSL